MQSTIQSGYFGALLTLVLVASTSAYGQNGNASPNAQGNDQWKTNGNQANPDHFIGTVNDRDLIFKSNNVERLRITPEGNVGIGTSTPATLLDVNGNAQFRNNVFLPGLPTLSLPFDNSYGMLLNDPAGATFRVSYADLLKKLTPDVYGYPELPPNFLSICELAGYLDNPVWHNGPNKIFSECLEVRVGIGTSTPRSTLDVIGTTFSEQVAIGIAPANASAQLHIKSSFTSPSYKLLTVENSTRKLLELDNAGLLHAREIKVDLQTWPDYVFEHDYDLRPLKDLEAYIQKEGHLPNVPSAKEIEENGMNVGEMNKIMMEKLEELTLYVIDLQKQVEEQNALIMELRIKE